MLYILLFMAILNLRAHRVTAGKKIYENCGGLFKSKSVIKNGNESIAACLYISDPKFTDATRTTIMDDIKDQYLLVFTAIGTDIFQLETKTIRQSVQFTVKKKTFVFRLWKIPPYEHTVPYQLVSNAYPASKTMKKLCGEPLWESTGSTELMNTNGHCSNFGLLIAESQGRTIWLNFTKVHISNEKVGFVAVMQVDEDRSYLSRFSTDADVLTGYYPAHNYLVIIVRFTSNEDGIALEYEKENIQFTSKRLGYWKKEVWPIGHWEKHKVPVDETTDEMDMPIVDVHRGENSDKYLMPDDMLELQTNYQSDEIYMKVQHDQDSDLEQDPDAINLV